MGGLLVLLAVAATSVTYGWQPDGNRGVEYIVQVSPDKLAQVRDTGEITSTIPPELQGHVSRVVIRVGNGQVPRTVPASVQQAIQASRLSKADRQSVPRPEMDGAAIVMKPQSGFSFPDAASRAGDRAAAGVNDAAARLKNGTSSTFNDLRDTARTSASNAAGNMRSAASDQLGRGTDAMSRAGNDAMDRLGTDRLGTDRVGTGARDNKWLPLDSQQRPSTDPITTRDRDLMQNPDFVGPMRPTDRRQLSDYTQAELDQLRRENATALNTRLAGTRSNADDSSRRTDARGFGPDERFGMMPAGMTSADRLTVEEQRRRDEDARLGNSDIGFADARLRLGNQRSQDDRLRQPLDDRRSSTFRETDLRRTTGDSRDVYDTRSPIDDRRIASTDRDSRLPAWATSSSDDRSSSASRNRDVDPRLSKADVERLPAGGYSFDEYDNPIDKQRRVLDRVGNLVSPQRAYELTIGRSNPALAQSNMVSRTGMPLPGAMTTGAMTTGAMTTGAMLPTLGQGIPGTAGQQQMQFGRTSGDPQYPQINGTRPNATGTPRNGSVFTTSSPSDRGPKSPAEKDRQSLAAQPLFNFLLLMSIVANVYLVFWLKNLRHQFHDLVSSKRVANGETAGI